MKKKMAFATTLCALVFGTALSAPRSDADIVDTAVAAGQFKTLTKLVSMAGLVDTLKGKGPFTVFAPTDKAFAKLPKGVVDAVVSDKKLLTQILTYHVIAGNVKSTDLRDGLKAKTVEGENITVRIHGKSVRFNNSGLIKADVTASNGVIHVIDTVLIPPSLMPAVKKIINGH